MQYFYTENGNQKGPMPVDELIKVIGPNTEVWCQGMSGWQPASQVPEIASAMGIICQQTYTNNNNQQNFGNNNFDQQQNQTRPSNYLVLAIISTICFCPIIGAFAIINANKVNKQFDEGYYRGAKEASDKAKNLSIVAIVVGVLLTVISIVSNLKL